MIDNQGEKMTNRDMAETLRLAQIHKERMNRAYGVYGEAALNKLAEDELDAGDTA